METALTLYGFWPSKEFSKFVQYDLISVSGSYIGELEKLALKSVSNRFKLLSSNILITGGMIHETELS